MIKFGDRIFNFKKKKQPDTREQDDRAHRSELPPESQEKQSEQHGDISDRERVERSMDERFKKVIKSNNAVYTMERCVSKLNKLVRTGILAAAVTASGGAISKEINHHLEQKQNYVTHQEYMKENEERSIAVLSKFFKDPSRVLRACGGVVDFQQNVADENAPLLMYIAQDHGTFNYIGSETYISQLYVSRCLIAMIEENNTVGENNTRGILPIGLELPAAGADRKERLRNFVKYYLRMLAASKGYGSTPDHGRTLFSEGSVGREELDEFPYKLNPENLSTLSNPVLSIIEHFKSEEMAKIMELFETGENLYFDINVTMVYANDTKESEHEYFNPLDQIMELLYEIEKEHSVHFEVTDKNTRTAEHPSEHIIDHLSLQDDQSFSKMISTVKRFYDEAVDERDKIAVDASLKLAQEVGEGVVVTVFGSAHGFGNDAERAGANLLRIETTPSNVHYGMLTYEATESYVLDSPYRGYGIPISPEIVQSWDLGGGGRETMKDYLFHTRRHNYHFLFRNIHVIQSVLQFSQDEWFSIIRDSIQDRKHLWAHGIYGDIEGYRNYVSAEQFASLKEGVQKCRDHENEKQ